MSRYKLLVTDVDGTLVGASGVPSEPVRAAVRRALDAGVQVALCSGRPLASCWPIARDLGLTGPQIVFNGALVKDPASSGDILSRPVPHAESRVVIDFCRREGLCLEFYDERTHYVERDRLESQLHAESIRVTYEIADFDRLLEKGAPIKFQIVVGDEHAKKAATELAAMMEGRLGFSIAIPMAPADGMECHNVVGFGVSKGQAIRALLQHYGIDRSQVVGSGDAPNDLPLFEEVGYKVVMANASADIRALADYIAPDVEEDGLARAIDKLLSAR